MIEASFCAGCVHYRSVGWKTAGSFKRNMVCNLLLDTGISRVKTGQTEVCRSHSVRGTKPLAHKYDIQPRQQQVSRYKQYLELYRKGLTDRQIAEKAGANVTAVANWLEYEGGGACAEVCGWLDWLRQPAEGE